MITLNHIFGLGTTGDEHNRQTRILFPNLLNHGYTIQNRHLDIGNDHIKRRLSQLFQPFFPVRSRDDFIASDHLFQTALDNETEILIVFY